MILGFLSTEPPISFCESQIYSLHMALKVSGFNFLGVFSLLLKEGVCCGRQLRQQCLSGWNQSSQDIAASREQFQV